MKTDQRNSVDRGRKPWLSSFSILLSLTIKTKKWALFALIPLLSQLKLKLDVWPTSCHVSTLARVRLWPEATHSASVQVQIISHELNPSHFPIFKISVNNLILGSYSTTITLKNMRIRLSRNSMKLVWVTRFLETNPTVSSVSLFEIYKISKFSTCTIMTNYRFAIFQKNLIFLGFYILSPL